MNPRTMIAMLIVACSASAALGEPLSADAVRQELNENPGQAKAHYQGRAVSISGVVKQAYTGYGNSGRPAIKLGTTTDDLVLCFLSQSTSLKAGDRATVSGTVNTVSDTFVGDGLRIEHCSAQPASVPAATNAADRPSILAGASAQRPAGPALDVSAKTLFEMLGNTPLMDTYQGKRIRVTGVLGPVSASDTSIYVSTATTHAVTCVGTPDPAVSVRGRGTPVAATGIVSRIFHGSSKYVLLDPCTIELPQG